MVQTTWTCKIKFLIEGLECYRPKGSHMKACDFTKATAELKRECTFVGCFGAAWWASPPEALAAVWPTL